MRRRSHRGVPACAGTAIVALLAAAFPGQGLAAKLVGGRRQAAIARAFSASRAHRGQAIVSIRASTASPGWTVVKSVRPGAGRSSGGTKIKLQSTYFHLAGGGERAGRPPSSVSSELGRDFKLAVVYAGSGSETIGYQRAYRSVCAGAGGYIEDESVSVSPMSWRLRYVVDLDDVVAAVTSPQGTVIMPSVAFDRGRSQLSAAEAITRQSVDAGCNGPTTTYRCTVTFRLPGSALDGLFSLTPGGGTEIGVPLGNSTGTPCDLDRLPLGPSLWDSGGTTALVGRLGLGGGSLPANPYAPIPVSWPASSPPLTGSFITGPCQSIALVCTDSFHWRGTVALQPASTG